MFDRIIEFIRSLYPGKDDIALHEPCFDQKEKEYVTAAIESTFVSYVGEYVNRFEEMMCDITGSAFAVATVNGTAALHTALLVNGVGRDDEVISQPLSFVATANAISYCGARPVFLDVDKETLGLDPMALEDFLEHDCSLRGDTCYNEKTGRRIAACVPMHTFGHPCRIDGDDAETTRRNLSPREPVGRIRRTRCPAERSGGGKDACTRKSRERYSCRRPKTFRKAVAGADDYRDRSPRRAEIVPGNYPCPGSEIQSPRFRI